MTANEQIQLGKTLWKIADKLRGIINVKQITHCPNAKNRIIAAAQKRAVAGLFPTIIDTGHALYLRVREPIQQPSTTNKTHG